MLTPTPNFGLNRWETTDEFDVDEVNDNADKIDLLAPPTVCTAGTRPNTNLFVGRMIWQTDTLEFYRYNGTNWARLQTGGALLVANTAARPTTDRHLGMVIYQDDVDEYYLWNGSDWIPQNTGLISKYRGYLNASAGLNTGVWGAYTFTDDAANTQGPYTFAASAASYNRTIPVTGIYSIKSKGTWAGATDTALRIARIQQNITGTDVSTGTTLDYYTIGSDGGSSPISTTAEVNLKLTAGDKVAPSFQQQSGGSINLLGATYYTYFEIELKQRLA